MLRRSLAACAIAACAIAACRSSDPAAPDAAAPDASITPECAEATTYSNLASIEAKIFPRCAAAGCHSGIGAGAGRLDLHVGQSHASLVGVASSLDPAHKLVVAGDRTKSYLLVMLGQVAPGAAVPPTTEPALGFMPFNNGGRLLCPEQRAAVERWITMGAANN